MASGVINTSVSSSFIRELIFTTTLMNICILSMKINVDNKQPFVTEFSLRQAVPKDNVTGGKKKDV